MSKVIEFIPRLSFKDYWHTIQDPEPSRKFIPDWYKKIPLWLNNDRVKAAMSLKGCVPFLDSFSSGYTIKTWFEINVVREDDSIHLLWGMGYQPINTRPDILIPTPAGYNKNMFAIDLPFGIKLPKGYSALVTSPLNRQDLPILIPSGIVDDDGIFYAGVMPFWVRDDFEGIIPIGTPFLQVIPFKRENWKSKVNKKESENAEKARSVHFTYFSGFYKKFVHKNKIYD
jgi:hypothetical protein